jgi:hypothetical protein
LRINSVNDHNNVSYRAYFKPNNFLESLHKNSVKSKYLDSAVKRFKEEVPQHELEILNYKSFKGAAILEIRNNTTRMVKDWLIPDGALALEIILNSLWLSKDSYFFAEHEVAETSFSDLI